MKLYCIDFDNCGYGYWIDESEIDIEEIDTRCPACDQLLLKYSDNSVPIFLAEYRQRFFSTASYDAVSVAIQEEDADTGFLNTTSED
jgi:hypothetical protein